MNTNERLRKLLEASPQQQAAIDAVLTGQPLAQPKASPSTAPMLLGMGEAAKLLNVSRPTLRRLVRAGRLRKFELLPNSFRIRRSDIEAFVQNGSEEA